MATREPFEPSSLPLGEAKEPAAAPVFGPTRRGDGRRPAVDSLACRPRLEAAVFLSAPRCLAVLLAGLAATGCRSTMDRAWNRWNRNHWVYDYEAAERGVRETGRESLILFRDDRPGAVEPMRDLLMSEEFGTLPERHVCCTLLRSHEPDRRYVAQFGVDRAPALILVHRDGTYHARTGRMSAEQIRAFLKSAVPPGATPKLSRYIPRRARYQWRTSLDQAEAEAQRTGQALLIVYYRPLSRDWHSISKALAPHPTVLRLSELIAVRVGISGFSNGPVATRFGALPLPSLVILRPDGVFDVLEMPQSSETIARFADACLRGQSPSAPDPDVLGAR